MGSKERMVSSLLVLLRYRFLSFKMSCTRKILLWGFFSRNYRHSFVIICLILGLRSVHGIIYLSGTIFRAALLMNPLYRFLGIQQNIIFLLWFMELSLFKILIMKGLSSFAFLRDCRTEKTLNLNLLKTRLQSGLVSHPVCAEGLFVC